MTRRPTPLEIAQHVAKDYAVTVEDIYGWSRTAMVARDEFVRRLRDELELSWHEIRIELGRKSHSGIIKAYRRAKGRK